jgi:hypothetical protein
MQGGFLGRLTTHSKGTPARLTIRFVLVVSRNRSPAHDHSPQRESEKIASSIQQIPDDQQQAISFVIGRRRRLP